MQLSYKLTMENGLIHFDIALIMSFIRSSDVSNFFWGEDYQIRINFSLNKGNKSLYIIFVQKIEQI